LPLNLRTGDWFKSSSPTLKAQRAASSIIRADTSKSTAKNTKYYSEMIKMHLVFKIFAEALNRKTRVIKQPKLSYNLSSLAYIADFNP
jgi:hypothetical protein